MRELFDYENNKELCPNTLSSAWWRKCPCNGGCWIWRTASRRIPRVKKFTLANIASIPMLALWQGITAVKWEGPPPVDARGFMAIMAQSASQPQLEAAGPRFSANLNYFMISKNFCHLSSRFGFHFSTVEALVGENQHENFLRFAFKGGGADYPRRLARARLVQEMLEKYDFKVDIKEDSVFARLDIGPMEYMLTRLRILGYISVHTRQLGHGDGQRGPGRPLPSQAFGGY